MNTRFFHGGSTHRRNLAKQGLGTTGIYTKRAQHKINKHNQPRPGAKYIHTERAGPAQKKCIQTRPDLNKQGSNTRDIYTERAQQKCTQPMPNTQEYIHREGLEQKSRA